MAPPLGLEPRAWSLVGTCSIRLSYGGAFQSIERGSQQMLGAAFDLSIRDRTQIEHVNRKIFSIDVRHPKTSPAT
jgi:hypothetical protein